MSAAISEGELVEIEARMRKVIWVVARCADEHQDPDKSYPHWVSQIPVFRRDLGRLIDLARRELTQVPAHEGHEDEPPAPAIPAAEKDPAETISQPPR